MARFGNYTQTKDGAVAAGATVSTGVMIPEGSDRIKGIIFSDQPGTLSIEQTFDESFWDLATTYTITAGAGRGFSEEIVAPKVRVRFISTGAGATTAFRLYANFSSAGAR
jgi:hypothetical protein